jgi:hypothetical protein
MLRDLLVGQNRSDLAYPSSLWGKVDSPLSSARQVGDNSGGLLGLTSEMVDSGRHIFEDWLEENSSVICEMGGLGQTDILFARLWDSWKKVS